MILTVLIVYCGIHEDKMPWDESCVRWKSTSGCYVGRGFFKKLRVGNTEQSSALYLSFSSIGDWIDVCSRVSWKASRFSISFWMQDISQLTLTQPKTYARNFSFTFIICPSIISQNTIDFFSKRKKERKRLKLVISRGSLLITSRPFDLGDQNFLT